MMKETEHMHQKTLFDWATLLTPFHPELKWLHAIPNGGKRHIAVAAKLKSEGVKAGIFDVFLPVAKCGYFGLYVEMKCGKNKLTPAQSEFKQFVEEQNYRAVVCYRAIDAIEIISAYVQGTLGDDNGTSVSSKARIMRRINSGDSLIRGVGHNAIMRDAERQK